MPTPSRRTVPANWWPDKWMLLDSPPASALDNMATDLALLRRSASTGRAVLRLYAWNRPTVSFGRHEAVRHVWDVDAMMAAGLEVVRRPTGGRALLHASPASAPHTHPRPDEDARLNADPHVLPPSDASDAHAHDVTYSVTLPLLPDQPWRDIYNAVNEQLLGALRSLGAPVTLSAHNSTVAPNGALCFAAPSEGEMMLGDQKIAGSAVWRADGGYLQHGSILLHNAQQLLERFRLARDADATPAFGEPSGAAASGRSRRLAGAVSPSSSLPTAAHSRWSDASSVAQAIRDSWREISRDICTLKPSAEDVSAQIIARHELAAPDWLWRR